MGRVVTKVDRADAAVALPVYSPSTRDVAVSAPERSAAPAQRTVAFADAAAGTVSGIASEAIESRQSLREAATRLEELEQSKRALAVAAEAAEKEGYAKGLAKAEQESARYIAQQRVELEELLNGLRDAKRALLGDAQDDIVEATYAAICKILGSELVKPEVARDAVMSTLSRLKGDSETMTVRVSKRDKPLLDTLVSGMDASKRRFVFEADDTVLLGGCVIRGERGTLEARLDIQLEALKRLLITCRDDEPAARDV